MEKPLRENILKLIISMDSVYFFCEIWTEISEITKEHNFVRSTSKSTLIYRLVTLNDYKEI